MAIQNLGYGENSVTIAIDGSHIQSVTSHTIDKNRTPEDILKAALHSPIGAQKLSEKLRPTDTVVIVIPDVTRLWQNPARYLSVLLDEIRKTGVEDKNITLISALGTHRKQREEEHRALVGENYGKVKIIDHDCHDESNLRYVGTTSRNTEVRFNKIALDADVLILTGGIVFHDLAGFGGGRKALLPGIAEYRTITQNHALSLNPDGKGNNPEVTSNRTEGNPIHEDMMEALNFVKAPLLLNVLVDEDGYLYHAVYGDAILAHQAGCEYLRKIDHVELEDKAEVVVTTCGGYPKDINFYQATKALSNAVHACKQGGDILLLAECREGLGHPDMAFMFDAFETNQEREEHLRNDYSISKFFAYMTCVFAQTFRITLVSSLPKESLSKIGIDIYESLDEALHVVRQRYDGAYKVYVFPNGASTLATCSGEEK